MKKITEDKKRLLSNFFSLSALQGVNMILPLLTLPYLVRVLGVENFGLVNFSLSIIMYFNILVSFGFELSATREISVHRDDIKMVSEIFSTVMLIKAFMFIVSFLILSGMIFFMDIVGEHSMLYVVTFGIVLANVLFPSWFFQGMERMTYITYINVASKSLFTVLIFIFVRDSTDYIYVPMFNSIGTILGGLYSLYLVFRLFSLQITMPSWIMIKSQLFKSYHFFLSRVANNGSRYYATTIIGLFFGNSIVGYFSMVEKLYYAFMSLGGIVSQTFYPYMSRTRNIDFFKKVLVLTLGVSILLLIPVIYYNKILLDLVFNEESVMLSNLFIIIFSGAIFAIASALIGYPLLAAFGEIKQANNSLIYASMIYMIYITVSAVIYKDIYLVAFSLVISALSGLLFRLYYIKKSEKFSWG